MYIVCCSHALLTNCFISASNVTSFCYYFSPGSCVSFSVSGIGLFKALWLSVYEIEIVTVMWTGMRKCVNNITAAELL